MSLRANLRSAPRDTLFEVMAEVRVGMLGVDGSGQAMQPMTHFPDAAAGRVWFITSLGSELVRAVGLGARAQHVVVHDQTFHASLQGTLTQADNPGKLDELWSPIIGAWFSGGRDDPDISLLCLDIQDAAIWASTSSTLKFGFEIARATVVPDHDPDVGDHVVLRFDNPD